MRSPQGSRFHSDGGGPLIDPGNREPRLGFGVA